MTVNNISNDASNHAQESPQISRMRGKLAKILETQDKRITAQAIQEKKSVITEAISKNASERVVLKEKLSLFDANQNSAEISKKVKDIADRLKKDFEENSFSFSNILLNKEVKHTATE